MYSKPAAHLLLLSFLCFFSCQQSPKEEVKSTTTVEKPKKKKQRKNEELDSLVEREATLFGYRFVVSGDFNGDGKKESLTENFISKINGQEVDQFLAADDEDGRNIQRVERWKTYTFLTCSNKKIDTLVFDQDAPTFGLAFLKNEGDLDGDGGDEISYVMRWADISNLNTCHIMSFKNNNWVHLYSFPMWDWQLPELPIYATKADWQKDNLHKEHKSHTQFAGLIKKVKPKTIEIVYRNDDAEEDTKIIDL